MSKFKTDEVVKCIDNTNVPNLVVGTTYRVVSSTDKYVQLSIAQNMTSDTGWFAPNKFSVDRFEPAEGKATYEWPPYNQPVFQFEDEAELTFGRILLRLKRAEKLLDTARHIAYEAGFDRFAYEVTEFLYE